MSRSSTGHARHHRTPVYRTSLERRLTLHVGKRLRVVPEQSAQPALRAADKDGMRSHKIGLRGLSALILGAWALGCSAAEAKTTTSIPTP